MGQKQQITRSGKGAGRLMMLKGSGKRQSLSNPPLYMSYCLSILETHHPQGSLTKVIKTLLHADQKLADPGEEGGSNKRRTRSPTSAPPISGGKGCVGGGGRGERMGAESVGGVAMRCRRQLQLIRQECRTAACAYLFCY